jgi:hypothetical protein
LIDARRFLSPWSGARGSPRYCHDKIQQTSVELLAIQGSDEWQAEREAAVEAANAARSEAAKGNDNAAKDRETKTVEPQNEASPISTEPKPTPKRSDPAKKAATLAAQRIGVSRATVERVTTIKRHDEKHGTDYAICTRLGLPFSIEWMSFESEADALAYVDLQQFARRNQSENWVFCQLGERYEAERKAIPNPLGLGGKSGKIVGGTDSQETCHQQKTAEKIAKEAGKSERTIRNAAKYSRAVKALAPTNDEKLRVVEEIRATVIKAAAMPEPKRKAIVAAMVENPKLTLKKAITEVRKEEEAGAAFVGSPLARLKRMSGLGETLPKIEGVI